MSLERCSCSACDSCESRAQRRYQATRGYRLIAGNDCKAGVYSALGPLVLPCRSFTSAGFITALVVVIVALGAVFFAFKFQTGRNPESIQEVIDMVYVACNQRVIIHPPPPPLQSWMPVISYMGVTCALQVPHEGQELAQQLRPNGRRRRRRRVSGVRVLCALQLAPVSFFASYAETMDDEPDVMNDIALRTVVR